MINVNLLNQLITKDKVKVLCNGKTMIKLPNFKSDNYFATFLFNDLGGCKPVIVYTDKEDIPNEYFIYFQEDMKSAINVFGFDGLECEEAYNLFREIKDISRKGKSSKIQAICYYGECVYRLENVQNINSRFKFKDFNAMKEAIEKSRSKENSLNNTL